MQILLLVLLVLIAIAVLVYWLAPEALVNLAVRAERASARLRRHERRVADFNWVYLDSGGNHSKMYSGGNGVHQNQAESYFSRLRRLFDGQVHNCRRKYFRVYVNEIAWREDLRRRSSTDQYRTYWAAAPAWDRPGTGQATGRATITPATGCSRSSADRSVSAGRDHDP